MKDELLICACSSDEHQIIIHNDDDIIYCSVHLVNLPFFKRLWNAIKYVFGYKCKYGNFEEFILSKKHVDSLKDVVKFLEESDND